jgi:hypothetical protein
MTKPHDSEGEFFDDFLRDEGIYEEVAVAAAARILARQLQEQIEAQGITKVEMARRMGTSRSRLDRLLNPGESGVTLETMSHASKAINRQLRFESV